MPEVLYGLSGELLAWYQYGEVLVVCFGPATTAFWIVAPTRARSREARPRGLRRLSDLSVSETDEDTLGANTVQVKILAGFCLPLA